MPHKPFVFFGTPYVARDTLVHLLEHGYTPSLVVTAPARPHGRGLMLTHTPTYELAVERGIPVLTPEKLDETAQHAVRSAQAEYALVVAYGKFLPQALLDAFPLGALNVHYSLLPKYRGASPVEAALLAGDTVTGVAIQKMVKEMDAGDVLKMEELEIRPDETTRELRPRLITLGANLLTEILPAFEAGTLTGTPQDHTQATFARKIEKAAGELHLDGNDEENWAKYRAYAESPGTYFYTNKNGMRIRVKIKTAKFEHGKFIPDRIVPEGKNEIAYADFISRQS